MKPHVILERYREEFPDCDWRYRAGRMAEEICELKGITDRFAFRQQLWDQARIERYEDALRKIAKKEPTKVGREEAADMACEFSIIARAAIENTPSQYAKE